MSLLKTPFCTGIGQVCSSIYQFISVSIFFKLNYDVAKTGEVTKKINDKELTGLSTKDAVKIIKEQTGEKTSYT